MSKDGAPTWFDKLTMPYESLDEWEARYRWCDVVSGLRSLAQLRTTSSLTSNLSQSRKLDA